MTFEDINTFGANRKPFLFVCDFLAQSIDAVPLDRLKESDIEFCIDENYQTKLHVDFDAKEPVSFELYKKKFDAVIEKIKATTVWTEIAMGITRMATHLMPFCSRRCCLSVPSQPRERIS